MALFLVFPCASTLGQTPGPNRNVVSGVNPDIFGCDPDRDEHCPPQDLPIKTDIYLQRQNEAVVAPSTNPEHLLAAANDYRTIDVAEDFGLGEDDEGFFQSLIASLGRAIARLFGWSSAEEEQTPAPLAQAPEAWMGVYRSCDRGRTWVGSLLPGSPLDLSPASLASPLRGYRGASDPILATGVDGRVYLGGMALTRGGPAAIFVARYTDRNNREGGACFNYDFARIVETGSATPTGKFADKPTIMADVTRATKNGAVRYVYMAYTRFTGLENGTNFRGNIMFSRSGNDGETWSAPKEISGNFIHNQSASIAIDPTNGTLYVIWRDFVDNQILMTQSSDFGETFAPPAPVHDGPMYPYDQATGDDHFRSNAVPTIVVDGNRNVFVAWQELVDNSGAPNPLGSPRIVVTKGVPGRRNQIDWGARRAVDLGQRRETRIERGPIDDFPRPSGPQLQPSLAFNAGQLMLLFYEFRDAEFSGGPISGRELQMDARVVELNPVTGAMFPGRSSAQVSEYTFTASTPPELVRTAPGFPAVNRPNLPMFRGGTASFVGDYTFLKAAVPFVEDGNGGMKWASAPGDVAGPSFHGVWTGNRNVLFPGDDINGNWREYGPPGSGLCVNPGSRNQDVFTSEISNGIVAGSPSLFKPLLRPNGEPIQRTFVVYVENRTAASRTVLLHLEPDDAADTTGSFDQFDPTQPDLPRADDPDAVFMEIFPYSTLTRPVYVESARADASVRFEVTDFNTGALLAVVQLNQTPPSFPLTNTQISDSEKHTPRLSNPRLSNPRLSNPRLSNPRLSNSMVSNPRLSNPRLSNAQLTADETYIDARDITYTITNDGNTTSVYNALTFVPDEYLDAVDENGDPIYEFQLLIYRTIADLGADLQGCTPVQILHDEVISNVESPRLSNPRLSNPRLSNPRLSNPRLSNPRLSNTAFYLEPAEGPVGQNSHGDPGNEDNHAPFRKDEVHWTLRVFQLREVEEGQPTLEELAPDDPSEPPLVSTTIVASSTNNVQGVIEDDPDVVFAGPEPPAPLKEFGGELVSLDIPIQLPDSLAFAVQPQDTQVDQPMRAIDVRLQDASGRTFPYTGTAITIALGVNPSGGTLSGTLTKLTDSGVVTFDDLAIDAVGTGYTLVATATDLTSATSAPFDITLEPPPVPPTTARASVRTDGGEGFGPDAGCTGGRSVTPDGRFVAFECTFTNLVDDDTNGFIDVFVRDLQTDTTTRVSVTSDRNEAHGDSFLASMSYDGRFVAFQSAAADLVASDTNGVTDIFVHDRDLDENGVFDETAAGKTSTTRVSIGLTGEANGASSFPAISGDGNYVAFLSEAGNLVATDTNDDTDVFLVDLQTMATLRLTQKSNGRDSDFAEGPVRAAPALSFDGQIVAFQSSRPDLVKNDSNGAQDILVYDRLTATITRASIATGGAEGMVPNGCPSTDTPEGTVTCDDLGAGSPSVSADGHFVAFDSVFSNLVPGDSNGALGLGQDAFLHDRLTGETSRVSVSTEGAEDNTDSDNILCPVGPSSPVLSPDSRFIAFSSCGSSLVANDTNGLRDSFLHDRLLGTTVRTSVANGGVEVATALGAFGSGFTAPANGASVVVFNSDVETLVSSDTNRNVPMGDLGNDIFAHEPIAAPTPPSGRTLAFAVQPSNTIAGDPISPTVQVAIQDTLGSTVTGSTDLVTLSVSTGPGPLLGTTSVNAVNGVATFSNVFIELVGSYTLRAEVAGLIAIESLAFDIAVGGPAKLGFLSQPNDALTGESLTPSIVVAVQDAFGNPFTAPLVVDAITMTLGNNPSVATLSGTTILSSNPTGGVVDFDDLSIDRGGIGYTLTASVTGLASATSAPFDIEGFTATANDMSSERENHTATLLADGTVLIAGGFANTGGLSSAELYDPVTRTFTPTAGLMTLRKALHTATLLPSGEVLLAGGTPATSLGLGADLYDPISQTFTATGNLGTGRSNHTATLLPDGTVLIVGGQIDTTPNFTDSAEIYDPATGTFTPTGSMATVRSSHTATLLPNGKVLIAGGAPGSQADPPPPSEIYDPQSGTFSPVGAMDLKRSRASATLLRSGRVLVTGRNSSSAQTAEIYDPETETFSPTGDMNSGRAWHQMTRLPDGRVLVSGGFNGVEQQVDTVDLYDPTSGTFVATGRMSAKRQNHTATLLTDGTVLITGGRTPNPTPPPQTLRLASAELFQAIPGPAFATDTALDQPSLRTEFALGAAVAGVGDINGDDVPDRLVGATASGNGLGRAFVRSGADGSVLLTLDNPNPQSAEDAFGISVTGLGDVNVDGIPDLAVGAVLEDVDGKGNAGVVFVFSGADGSLLHTVEGPAPRASAFFGLSITGIDDIDGDSVPDLVVGSPFRDVDGNVHQGRVYVISGADGSTLQTVDHPSGATNTEFGLSVAAAGDIGGTPAGADGVPDILVTSRGSLGTGQAFVFSGADSSLLLTLDTPNPQMSGAFGHSSDGVDDLNGDGVPDLVVGARGEERVYVFSGDDGALVHTLTNPSPGSSEFGNAVAGVGDLDGDMVPDVVVGAPSQTVSATSQGQVLVFSGATGSLLTTLDSPISQSGARFGHAVAEIGNIDGAGPPELLVAASVLDVGGLVDAGEDFVFFTSIPTQLVFTTQPTTATAAETMAPVEVTLLDGFGNVARSVTADVTLSLNKVNPGPVGALFGTTTVAVINGVATFSDLSIDIDGIYELEASAAGLPAAMSNNFTVQAASGPITFIVTNVSDSGAGSLRQAMIAANGNLGPTDVISFNISPAGQHTIQPSTALPIITDPVVIDGTTQPGALPGAPVIEIDGSVAGGNGIHIEAGESTVRGLVVNRFQTGIVLDASFGPVINTVIEGNYVGTDVTGTSALGNTLDGILVFGAAGNTIGGTSPASRNVISGNARGIVFDQASATGNVAQGNYIGTNAAGTASLPNTIIGILVGQSASSNTIGGSVAGSRNVISGNGVGVQIQLNATTNRVEGNYIGTAADGMAALGNTTGVVVDFGATDNVIGDVGGARNVISGNVTGVSLRGGAGTLVQGNYIGLNADGDSAQPNSATGVLIDTDSSSNTLRDNVISGNGDLLGSVGVGVVIRTAAGGNMVFANRIGTDATGTVAIGNRDDGIVIEDSPDNIIGSPGSEWNIVSGNLSDGIVVVGTASTNNLLINNRIGTDASGTAALGNGLGSMVCCGTGVYIDSPNVNVEGNVISGNQAGLGTGPNAQGTRIQGNRVGTTADGTAALGNIGNGITLEGSNDIVGGVSAIHRNVISANGNGVELSGSGHLLLGNYIGLNAAGDTALGNTGVGVRVSGSNHTLGDTTAGGGNVISGNVGVGVRFVGASSTGHQVRGNFIGTDAAGTSAIGNSRGIVSSASVASNILIGGTTVAARNIISGNRFGGVSFSPGTTSSNLEGNYIGLDVNGDALANGGAGVAIDASDNFVGGGIPGAGNFISGNDGDGITIAAGANDNRVQGNWIGTSLTGTSATPNNGNGVFIEGSGNWIGGATNTRNIISGNSGSGISIVGAGATGNLVVANYIGTNTAGDAALPNTDGIVIEAPNNVVGSEIEILGNVVSGNLGDGIRFFGSNATSNVVVGNKIGTNVAGDMALGNGGNGVSIHANNNVIGGPAAGARNIISANGGHGVQIGSSAVAASLNLVEIAFIGTDVSGTLPLGNTLAGVSLEQGANLNRIGGALSAAQSNLIAFNGDAGIRLVPAASTGNLLSINRWHSNGGLGIDLGADGLVEPIDTGDSDTGPNALQNFPVLTSATSDGVNLTLGYSIESTPGATLELNFYSSTVCDPSGFGEGEALVATRTIVNGPAGNLSETFVTAVSVPAGAFITATATDAALNTSEFSACELVTP